VARAGFFEGNRGTDRHAEEAREYTAVGRAMANREHLDRLRAGVEAWNLWRAGDSVIPDLSEANLSRFNLNKYDLSRADMFETDLSGAELVEANVNKANLRQTNLAGSNLEDANFRWAVLDYADLSAARLVRADLIVTRMRSADLTEADLTEADLSQAELTHSELCGANLRDATLVEADLQKADLTDSAWAGALLGHTIFADNDLSTVTGLAAATHVAPSTVGIDTIYRSKGRIPEQFLRGAGVPEDFIIFARSLAANPIEFYSCFISYSGKDDAFAKELHTKLQAQGVRCWFAPEDLKIGDRFQERIEESIRLYDKLLVVLSENSVNSAWVEREVQAAFEKEQRQGSTVLFPVRLDDAVMDSLRAWAAAIRRTRHIGDFRKWKDHDSFQKALDRLLRDLKSQD